jgi:hypothetical protein
MGKCRKCGTVVSSSGKKWTMAGRPSKAGKRTQLEIGLFDCPKCKKLFREVVSKKIVLTLPDGNILRFAKGVWAC